MRQVNLALLFRLLVKELNISNSKKSVCYSVYSLFPIESVDWRPEGYQKIVLSNEAIKEKCNLEQMANCCNWPTKCFIISFCDLLNVQSTHSCSLKFTDFYIDPKIIGNRERWTFFYYSTNLKKTVKIDLESYN